MIETVFSGLGGVEIALTTVRVATGTFFAISGAHKLFHKARHETLRDTLVADGVPFIRFNEWFVPAVEFLGGLAVVIGLLTPLAAFGLLAICCVACAVDGIKKICAWNPLNRADWLDDLLYLPETIYALFLSVLVAGGAGRYSVDALILSILF